MVNIYKGFIAKAFNINSKTIIITIYYFPKTQVAIPIKSSAISYCLKLLYFESNTGAEISPFSYFTFPSPRRFANSFSRVALQITRCFLFTLLYSKHIQDPSAKYLISEQTALTISRSVLSGIFILTISVLILLSAL